MACESGEERGVWDVVLLRALLDPQRPFTPAGDLVTGDLVKAKLLGSEVRPTQKSRVDLFHGKLCQHFVVETCIGVGPVVGENSRVLLLPVKGVPEAEGILTSASQLRKLIVTGAALGCGSIIGVIGPSGAGKSVCVSMACDLESVVLVQARASEVMRLSSDTSFRIGLKRFSDLGKELRKAGLRTAILLDDVDDYPLENRSTAALVLTARRAAEEANMTVFISSKTEKALPGPILSVIDHMEYIAPPSSIEDRTKLVLSCHRLVGKAVDEELLPEYTEKSAGLFPRQVAFACSATQVTSAFDLIRQTSNQRSVRALTSMRLAQEGPETPVFGLQAAINAVEEAVLWPTQRKEELTALDVAPPRGILLYGPAGTGKTSLVKTLARRVECAIVSVDAATLIHGEVGESEKSLEKAFDLARALRPCIMFIDEVEALFESRAAESATSSRLVSVLAVELDSGGAPVLAATNRPWDIDSALLRLGRFERCIHVPLPHRNTRRQILDYHVEQMKMEGNLEAQMDKYVQKCFLHQHKKACVIWSKNFLRGLTVFFSPSFGTSLVSILMRTEGFSGADLQGLMRVAGLEWFARGGCNPIKPPITIEDDLLKALGQVKPSVGLGESFRLQSWRSHS